MTSNGNATFNIQVPGNINEFTGAYSLTFLVTPRNGDLVRLKRLNIVGLMHVCTLLGANATNIVDETAFDGTYSQ